MDIREQMSQLSALTVVCGDADIEKLSKNITDNFNYTCKICGTSVDDVRETIQSSYTITMPIVFIFPHIEKMSINAINSLLKVTEEPPNSAKFILTVDDIANIIPTIHSRATIIRVPPRELNFSNDLIDFCYLVYTNIARVPLTNALKISNRIKLKDTDTDKFELIDFLSCMRIIYATNFKYFGEKEEWGAFDKLFNKYLATEIAICQLRSTRGIKKDSLLDEWIIKIRGVGTDEKEYSRDCNGVVQ